jgi:hypothetical protein
MSNEADQQSTSTSRSAYEADVRAFYHRRNCDARQVTPFVSDFVKVNNFEQMPVLPLSPGNKC